MAALLAACGGHWLVLQSVAWTTMLVDYSRDGGVASAVEKTFDGRHPCDLCKSIEKGRKNEKKQDVQIVISKLTLFYQASSNRLMPPLDFWDQHVSENIAQTRTDPPLLPPPRGFLG